MIRKTSLILNSIVVILSLGLAQGHLIESVPVSVTVKFKNGNAATLTAMNDRLESLEVTLNNKVMVVEKKNLSNLPFPNLRSVHLLETDLDQVKKHFLRIRFGVAPDGHGSTMSDDDGHSATFIFVDGRYSSRTVDLVDSGSDPFAPPPIKPLTEKKKAAASDNDEPSN